MDSISNARNFFINQQGLSSEEADTLISKGLESYNQQRQPQSIMQMASGGRAGYQMGGLSTMSMDTGAPLQVPPQQQSMFTATGNATSNPLLNYGQTPLTMSRGGITRLNYQEGGLTDFYNNKEPIIPRIENIGGLLDQAEQSIGEPTNNITSPLATAFSGFGMRDGGIARLGYQMGGDVDMSQMGQMDPQQALTIILQMLIEKGIPIEEAKALAKKIIELFAQGGAPAVEAFADQLEQEEAQAMASGGIAGYAQRQGYFLGGIGKAIGSVFKGIGKAVKSIANSTIGKIALTIAAVTFGGPLLASSLAISGPAAAALAAGLTNSALQLASGKGFNPLEALISAGGAYVGAGGLGGTDVANAATNVGTKAAEANLANYVSANPVSSLATAEQLTNPAYFSPTEYGSALTNLTPASQAGAAMYTDYAPLPLTNSQIQAAGAGPQLTGELGTGYATPKGNLPFQLQGVGNTSPIDMNAVYNDYSYPSFGDKIQSSVSNFGKSMTERAQTGIQNLYQDPLGTIRDLASSAYTKLKDNALPLGTGFLLGSTLTGAPEEEDDEDKKREEEVRALLNYYGRNLKVDNPYFYSQYKAVNPFQTAADGGIIGYRQGYKGAGMVSPRSNPTQQDELNQAALDVFKRPLHQLSPEEVDMLIEFIKEKFGRMPAQQDTTFAAAGGPMVPPARQIEGGIIELDARKTGGYIPYGKKERVDDVPAMLAKDEFVFTSRAVKGAGNGSARQGAAKMYELMKQLESKGRKMEQGARS